MAWRALLFALCAAAAAHGAEPDGADRGRTIYLGESALVARIAGQDFALPANASRCANCHSPAARPSAIGASAVPADAQRIGPVLTPEWLTQPQRRRGGPASRYDSAALCKLLRSGVDPAHVIILRTMPRYDISDTDCAALWRYLTESKPRR